MIVNVKGLVLRSVKYGDTSLISTIFTNTYGVQSFLTQGVRSVKSKNNKAALLQPGTLLELVVYHKPTTTLQRIKEMHPAYIYQSLQEDIVKNSIALFSIEILLRLLPEQAPQPTIFDFAENYFIQLDRLNPSSAANFPLYFVIKCSEYLGYMLRGNYSDQTPFLHLQEGAFLKNEPLVRPFLQKQEALLLDRLRNAEKTEDIERIEMNANTRYHLIDWFLQFLHLHTQHMNSIRSLSVLQSILH